MDYLTASLNLTELSASGEIAGIAATWAPNRNGWEPDPGAISASLLRHRQRGSMPAMLLYHDHHRPAGRWTEIAVKGDGLHVRGKLAIDSTDGREAYTLLRAGALGGLSLGLGGDTTHEPGQAMPSGRPARRYTKADLDEISLCTIGADPAALVRTVASVASARDVETLLVECGVSGRRAKAGASAAWRAIAGTSEPDPTALRTILGDASRALGRFHRSN